VRWTRWGEAIRLHAWTWLWLYHFGTRGSTRNKGRVLAFDPLPNGIDGSCWGYLLGSLLTWSSCSKSRAMWWTTSRSANIVKGWHEVVQKAFFSGEWKWEKRRKNGWFTISNQPQFKCNNAKHATSSNFSRSATTTLAWNACHSRLTATTTRHDTPSCNF